MLHLAPIIITEQTSIVGLINTFGLIILAIIGWLTARRVRRVRDQVENGHSTNMREEGDTRHDENTAKLDTLIQGQTSIEAVQKTQGDTLERLAKFAGHLGERLDTLFDTSVRQGESIHELELTRPPTRPLNRRKRT